jgi:hypothetical protein
VETKKKKGTPLYDSNSVEQPLYGSGYEIKPSKKDSFRELPHVATSKQKKNGSREKRKHAAVRSENTVKLL